jgi:ABC-type Mn2+/Zn2+ transport system permease subunit/Mn-dependent DtxR family transcriptional regulator
VTAVRGTYGWEGFSSVWDRVVGPLVQYGFMRYGVAVAAIVGITSAVLSCLLVVRRQALLGDAVAHAVLLGVAVGWIGARHVGIFWGALAAGVLAGVTITYVERNSRLKTDAAMGVVFTFAFALGLAIIGITRPRGIDLFHVLLGNVLGVGRGDLVLTATSGGLVLLVVAALYKELHLWSFDPVVARAMGLPTRWLEYLFTALLAATIVAALQAVGLVLVIAMLVTPGATAHLLADRLGSMIAVAVVVGLVAGVGGLYGSFYVDVASGPAMVIVASLLFVAAFLFAPRRGTVARWVQRGRSARRMLEEDLLKFVYKAVHEDGLAPSVDDLVNRGGWQRDAVRRAVRRLLARGLVVASDDGLRPTPSGSRAALQLVRAHRLLETYLHDAEGLPLADLHAEADRREHDVPAEVIEDIDRVLGRPRVDPHGHPIPSAGGRLARIAGRALVDTPPGSTGRVSMVRDDRDDLLREMVRLGIVPEETVTVLGRGGACLRVRLGSREADLPEEIAERVYVVPLGRE